MHPYVHHMVIPTQLCTPDTHEIHFKKPRIFFIYKIDMHPKSKSSHTTASSENLFFGRTMRQVSDQKDKFARLSRNGEEQDAPKAWPQIAIVISNS